MLRAAAAIGLVLVALGATSTGSLAGQDPMTRDEVVAAIVGKTFDAPYGQTFIYAQSGEFSWRDARHGKTSQGTYTVLEGGFVCINFPPSDFRCDRLVKDGPYLALRTSADTSNRMYTLTERDYSRSATRPTR